VSRALAALLLSSAAVVIALLLVELGLTLVDFPPAPTESQRLFVEYDSVRGWRNVRGGHARMVTPEFTVKLDYNDRSYRGPLHDYRREPGRPRVLLLGDSYLEGYTVALKDRVAEVAESLLQKTPPSRGTADIIALGTGGYSTDQELLWLESEGLRYTPDLVVLLFVDNDYWYNARERYPRGEKPLFRVSGDSLVLSNVPVPRPPPDSSRTEPNPGPGTRTKRFLSRHLHLYRLLKLGIRRSPKLQSLGARLGLIEAPETVSTGGGSIAAPAEFSIFANPLPPSADSAVTVTAKLLTRMAREVRSSGAAFRVIHVPSNAAIYPPGAPQSATFQRQAPFNAPERSGQLFIRTCRLAAVPCLEPTPAFVTAAESLAVRKQLLVFPQDGHWNEHGHRLAGKILANLIRVTLDSLER